MLQSRRNLLRTFSITSIPPKQRTYTRICDWCQRRIVGIGAPPKMFHIEAWNDSPTPWVICLDCRSKLNRLVTRLSKGQSSGAIR